MFFGVFTIPWVGFSPGKGRGVCRQEFGIKGGILSHPVGKIPLGKAIKETEESCEFILIKGRKRPLGHVPLKISKAGRVKAKQIKKVFIGTLRAGSSLVKMGLKLEKCGK